MDTLELQYQHYPHPSSIFISFTVQHTLQSKTSLKKIDQVNEREYRSPYAKIASTIPTSKSDASKQALFEVASEACCLGSFLQTGDNFSQNLYCTALAPQN